MPLALIKRADFSHALVHFTKERLEAVGDPPAIKQVPPFQVLQEILTSAVILGSGNSGYVKGNQRAVCMSEVPLSAIAGFADPPEVKEGAKYRFYGVCMSKEAVFNLGGRPVIYLPDNEGDWIPADQKWRHVRYEHGSVDWTHEREWRLRGDVDLRKLPGLYVFVWSATEAREISSLKTPVSELIRGVLPMQHITTML